MSTTGNRGAEITRVVVLKLLRLIGVLFAVAVLCFFSLSLLPGSPAQAILGVAGSSPKAVAALNHQLGVDQPLLHRFVTWIGDVLQGDLGHSYQSGESVSHIIGQTAPLTLELILLSQIVALLFAIPTALIAAARRGSLTDQGLGAVALTVLSTPNFVIGFVLIWVFAIGAGLLPASGYAKMSEGLGAHLESLVLPVICLAAAPFGLYQRILRADLVGTYDSEFMSVARAKGLSPTRRAMRHALRPSLLGLTTSVGTMMGTLIGASVIVETLFGLPGLGAQLSQAVNNRDYVVVQGIVLVVATFFVVVVTVIDLSYALIDPRLRSVRAIGRAR
jgi:peptide/nickel transport system permease protein